MKKEDFYILNRHSDWDVDLIDQILKENVYSSSDSWQKFLKLFFIGLGICFTTAGVVFFFAYNWDELHKFLKLSVIEFLITALIVSAVFGKINPLLKNILIASSTMIVGVLIGVFGQIYQTGANAYDFFFGWTLAIALWALISNYPVLWLIFILLTNITFILFANQIASDWSSVSVLLGLTIINAFFLSIFNQLPKIFSIVKSSKWFLNLLGLVTISFATLGIVIGIFDQKEFAFTILAITTSITFCVGLYFALKHKNVFYLSAIPIGIIAIISSFIVKISDGAASFLFVCLFVIFSITFLVKKLIDIQKSEE